MFDEDRFGEWKVASRISWLAVIQGIVPKLFKSKHQGIQRVVVALNERQNILSNHWKIHESITRINIKICSMYWKMTSGKKTAVGADLTNAVDIAQTEILTPSCTILHLLIPTLIRCHPESQTSKAAISELCPGNSINTSTSAHQNQEQLANIVKSYLERNSHQHQPTT